MRRLPGLIGLAAAAAFGASVVVFALGDAQGLPRRAVVAGLAADSAPSVTNTPSATPTPSPTPTRTATSTATPGGPAAAEVAIAGFAFSPPSVTIEVGQAARWTHQDGNASHGVTIPGVFQSQVGTAGLTFTFTFTAEGVFSYRCTVHSFMTGTVVVVAPDQGVES
ncbi:MAG: plastocyanin/azurin family copper-binding protein [Dehalococcoidia bacterium]